MHCVAQFIKFQCRKCHFLTLKILNSPKSIYMYMFPDTVIHEISRHWTEFQRFHWFGKDTKLRGHVYETKENMGPGKLESRRHDRCLTFLQYKRYKMLLMIKKVFDFTIGKAVHRVRTPKNNWMSYECTIRTKITILSTIPNQRLFIFFSTGW